MWIQVLKKQRDYYDNLVENILSIIPSTDHEAITKNKYQINEDLNKDIVEDHVNLK